MELEKFIEQFADQFDDPTIMKLTHDTRFRDLDEWSSLVALSVIAMIDEEYDVTIKGDDMKAANTIGELFNIVKSKL